MITFGLTGGIATGKSTIAKTLDRVGIPTIDADMIARQVVEPDTQGLRQLVEAFGVDILQPDQSLDRTKLSELVFSSSNLELRTQNMQKLNAIMLPLIRASCQQQFTLLSNNGIKLACFDAAMLVENGQVELYRPLVVAHCSPSVQLSRLMLRGTGRGPLTRERAMDIISSQASSTERLKWADYAIDTNGTIAESIEQTEVVIQQLRRFSQ